MIKKGASISVFWFGALFVFLMDQFTKLLALKFLPFDKEIIINGYLSFHFIYNESTFLLVYDANYFEIDKIVFRLLYVILSIILLSSIVWVMKQPSMNSSYCWVSEFAKTGMFLIVGGLIGNTFDRVFREDGVIDFLRINIFSDSAPIVNFADIVILVGEICLIIAWVLIFKRILSKIVNNSRQKISFFNAR